MPSKWDWQEDLHNMLESFRKQPLICKSGYVTYENASVYIRVGYQMIEGAMTPCVQIANISMPEEFQGKGCFKRLVENIMQMTDMTIFVELVHNEKFAMGLPNHGFVQTENVSWGAPSFYLKAR